MSNVPVNFMPIASNYCADNGYLEIQGVPEIPNIAQSNFSLNINFPSIHQNRIEKINWREPTLGGAIMSSSYAYYVQVDLGRGQRLYSIQINYSQ